MRSRNVLRLISNKVTSRSYSYFLKFSYFDFLRNWFFQLCQKLQSLVKKTQGILGVNTHFQQNFTTGSYGVGIGQAWCSRKACKICSSLVQKKKLKFFNFSSHKLPKQQLTNVWSQGILGVKVRGYAMDKGLSGIFHSKGVLEYYIPWAELEVCNISGCPRSIR
jgi:hypothetical protein